MVIAMHKPRGMIAIMFGAPSRLAHEDGPQRDEDSLDREDSGGHFDSGGPADTLQLIYERLKQGDDTAGHAAMSIARCMQEMAHQAARRNNAGLKHWYEKCCDLIAHVDGDGDGDGE